MKTYYVVCGIVQKGNDIALGRKPAGQPPYPDAWHLPGGKVEDTAKAARLFQRTDFDNAYFHDEVRREIREEMNIEVANIRCVVPGYVPEPDEDTIPNKHGELTHYHYLTYFCDYASGDLKGASDLISASWVVRTELPELDLTPPSVKLFQEIGWLTHRNADGSVTSPLDTLPLWPLMSTVAWQVAGPILALGIGGALLDHRLHTAALFLLLGVILSVAVSWVLVSRTVRRFQLLAERRIKESDSRDVRND